MKQKLLIWFVRWYRKWVLAECRHLCGMCEFKEQCKHDDSWWLDVSTLGFYDADDYGDYKSDWS